MLAISRHYAVVRALALVSEFRLGHGALLYSPLRQLMKYASYMAFHIMAKMKAGANLTGNQLLVVLTNSDRDIITV